MRVTEKEEMGGGIYLRGVTGRFPKVIEVISKSELMEEKTHMGIKHFAAAKKGVGDSCATAGKSFFTYQPHLPGGREKMPLWVTGEDSNFQDFCKLCYLVNVLSAATAKLTNLGNVQRYARPIQVGSSSTFVLPLTYETAQRKCLRIN